MKIYITILATCFCLVAAAQSQDASRRRNFNNDHDVAMKEFDPVSYFSGKPLRGSSKISFPYKGLVYYFSSEANREIFKKAPGKYEPAYGGWCAYSMAETGERVKMDPATYKIVNGKVYLFSNFNGSSSLLKWNANEKKFKKAADQNWIRKMH